MAVDDEQVRQIFEEKVWPHIASREHGSDRRVLLELGGQPGAGKSMAQRLLVSRHDDAAVVSVVGDDLRVFHPDYARVLAEDPLRMPDVTAAAAGRWTGMCVDRCLGEGRSVFVEGTWRDPRMVLDTIAQAREAGYTVEAGVIATPPPLSRLGTFSRYYRDKADPLLDARWTPVEAHARVVDGLPEAVREIAGSADVERFTVVDRAGTVHFDAAYSPSRGDAAHEAFMGQFARELSGPERQFITREVGELRTLYHELGTSTIEDQAWVVLDSELTEYLPRPGGTDPGQQAVASVALRAAQLARQSFARDPGQAVAGGVRQAGDALTQGRGPRTGPFRGDRGAQPER